MALLDKVPGDLQLYIGGLFTLRRKEAIRDSGITHILSVLRLPLDSALFQGFEHKVVEVDDVDDENLLEHFPACNKFIEDGINSGGAVFVHCAMGKSRSATVVCAYLMNRYGVTAAQALAQIREVRPFCEPNDGFMHQLKLYHQMATPENVEETPAYQRWLYQREVEMSRACGQAPEADKIRFEDEHAADRSSSAYELRCKKCRRPLATSQFVLEHVPGTRAQPNGTASSPSWGSSPSSLTQSQSCAHYFLDPLSWMRPELEGGKLDGRLECPKCKTNVGKYAWQGMQCSCGDWIVPGISLAKGRVDEIKSRPQTESAAASTTNSMGIRMPAQTPSGYGKQKLNL